jgi:mycothiol synthase
MIKKVEGLLIRHPSMDDARITLDLMVAYDIAEYGEPDSNLEDLTDGWPNIDLNQDAWLAFNTDKQLVGYAAVFRADLRFNFDFYTHPALAPDGLSRYLLELCEQRALAQLSEANRQAYAIIIISPANSADKHMADELGYTPEKYHFGMSISFDSPPQSAKWPDGVTLRNVVPGQDDRLVFDFIQTAFDRPGRVPPSFERWHNFMMEAANFNPELWFLAYHREELIGANLCFDYPQYGWVRQLAVAKAWRGRGIGSNLLRHIFGIFYASGHKTVDLAVEADNSNAYQLYESVGMCCKRRYAEYRKILI